MNGYCQVRPYTFIACVYIRECTVVNRVTFYNVAGEPFLYSW